MLPGKNWVIRIVLLIVNLLLSELWENGISDLVVHLHFSDSVIWPNLDIRRSESQPKLATSFSPNSLVKQKLSLWQPVWRLGKIGVLSFYIFEK